MPPYALALCLMWAVVAAADPAPLLLVSGRAQEIVLDFADENLRVFAVDVPDGACALHVRIKDTPLDLELTAKRDGATEEWQGSENALTITRDGDPPLATGHYVVSVDFAGAVPYYRGRQLVRAPYTIIATLIVPKIEGVLRVGVPTEGRIVAAEGRMRTYAIDVPDDATALRVDLDATIADLDLYLRRDEPMVMVDDADHSGATLASRDWIVIDKSSNPPLAPGRWCVMVLDPSGLETARFTLHLSFAPAPPARLTAIPPLPAGTTALERAFGASLEVASGASAGSGTLVSPDGLVLTNHHVIAAVIPLLAREGRSFASPDEIKALRPGTPDALDEIVLAATLDPRYPTVELFRGQLVAYDEDGDLALVRITTGYYGQPLPAGYTFPWVPLGDPSALRHGDVLHFIGFPLIASLRSRPTVTLTRGILSGFETTDEGRSRIRSDGQISSGNSGGATLNAKGELVGVPSMTMDVGGPQSFGYTFSIADLPRPWRALFGQAAGGSGSGK